MNTFAQRKQDVLKKADKSKIGEFDKAMIPLIDVVNTFDNYYTTSTCSGRILFILKHISGQKQKAQWILTSHEPVEKIPEVFAAKDYTLWFKQEPFIIHICCRTIESANDLLVIAREVGLKHSGITIITPRHVMVQIIGNERIETPISAEGELLVDDEAVEKLVMHANKKLEKNLEILKKLEKKLLSHKEID